MCPAFQWQCQSLGRSGGSNASARGVRLNGLIISDENIGVPLTMPSMRRKACQRLPAQKGWRVGKWGAIASEEDRGEEFHFLLFPHVCAHLSAHTPLSLSLPFTGAQRRCFSLPYFVKLLSSFGGRAFAVYSLL